jgi:homogentisate 1,2-dioxygenase
MNEFMGLIRGQYDGKASGFVPGGASLHNCMSAHGPDAATYELAVQSDLKPQFLRDTLAFMFETQFVIRPTKFAMETAALQRDYDNCWRDLRQHFSEIGE